MQLFFWVVFCPITTMLLVNRAILVKVSFGERLLTCMHEERYHLSVVIKKSNRIYCDYEIGQLQAVMVIMNVTIAVLNSCGIFAPLLV